MFFKNDLYFTFEKDGKFFPFSTKTTYELTKL